MVSSGIALRMLAFILQQVIGFVPMVILSCKPIFAFGSVTQLCYTSGCFAVLGIRVCSESASVMFDAHQSLRAESHHLMGS